MNIRNDKKKLITWIKKFQIVYGKTTKNKVQNKLEEYITYDK